MAGNVVLMLLEVVCGKRAIRRGILSPLISSKKINRQGPEQSRTSAASRVESGPVTSRHGPGWADELDQQL